MHLAKSVVLAESNRVGLGSEDEKGRPRFKMLAYTGAEVSFYGERAVFDTQGMEIASQRSPIFRQHDPNRIAGFSDKIEKTGVKILIEGVLCDSEAGQEVARLGKEGFPWQASIGLSDCRWREVPAGEGVRVNGLRLVGPIAVAERSVLRESSFVPLGADGATKGVVLARTQANVRMLDIKAEALLAERMRFKELRDAFPGDIPFVLEQIQKGSTVSEAKAAYPLYVVAMGHERAKGDGVGFVEGMSRSHSDHPEVREMMRRLSRERNDDAFAAKKAVIVERLERARIIKAARDIPILEALRIADREMAAEERSLQR